MSAADSVDFIHLHTHSDSSTLDGLPTVAEYVIRANELGMKGLALTEHGNMRSIVQLYMKTQGKFSYNGEDYDFKPIKPIAGIEFYMSPINHLIKGIPEGEKAALKSKCVSTAEYREQLKNLEDKLKIRKRYHLLAFAKNNIGYKNLLKLNYVAWKDGFYYRPRIDMELLEKYSEGIIVTTACIGGMAPNLIINKQNDESYIWLKKLKKIFKDDVYVEIQPHNIPDQVVANLGMIELANELKIKIAATNDCHYLKKDDYQTHNVLLAIQSRKTLQAADAWRFDDDAFYMKDKYEMFETFRANHPDITKRDIKESLENTMEIYEKCNIHMSIDKKQGILPKVTIPKEYKSPKNYLVMMSKDGWKWRGIKKRSQNYAKMKGITEEESYQIYKDRLKMEMERIFKLKFEKYFIIIHELIWWARKQDIMVGPGRGCFLSGSKVYVKHLGFTSIEKVKIGTFVLTNDTSYQKVLDRYEYVVDEVCTRLILSNGKKIECTQDHFIMTKDGWMKASKLFAGDELLAPIANKRTEEIKVKCGDFEIWTEKELSEKNDLLHKTITVIRTETFGHKGKVYDLKVDKVENYTISGITVHNSSSGSIVCYLLGITSVDPIEYGLLFDRFLNESRIDYPDVDMDFEDTRRKEVFKHLFDKYGEHHVSLVGTFGKLKGKQALQDVGRVLSIPHIETLQVTKHIVVRSGGDARANQSVEDSFKEFDVCKQYDKNHPDALPYVKKLEGKIRQVGIHACGIQLSPMIMEEFIPVEYRTIKNEEEIKLWGNNRLKVSAIDWKDSQEMGLVKIDVLGLKTLSVIKTALKAIEERHSKIIDPEKLDLEDKVVLGGFTKGDFVGIFQFDSIGMTKTCEKLTFDKFEDIITMNALYRPGGMRCLSSETRIMQNWWNDKKKNNTKRFIHITIKEMYEKWNDNEINPIRTILSYDENTGKVVKNEIIKIEKSGIKKVYSLDIRLFQKKNKCNKNPNRTRNLKASAEHKIMTIDGWKKIKDITSLDYVLVKYNNTVGKSKRKYGMHHISEHNKRMHTLQDRAKFFYKDRCFICGYDAFTDVCHIDRNRNNNSIDNYLILCPNHHREFDGGVLKLGDEMIEKLKSENWLGNSYDDDFIFSKVNSKKYEGEVETYDIECKSPLNNYIAGEVVVHNSGLSQHFINRKIGKEKIEKLHPIYDEITESTMGVLVYQEQLIKCFVELAGYHPGTADEIRKAVAKSFGVEFINKQKVIFVEGAVKNGMDKKKADELFENISFFGCLTGDTTVHRISANQYQKEQISLKDLYKYQEKPYNNLLYKKLKLKCYIEDEDRVKINDMIKVVKTGVKKVYLVKTESGKFSKSTMEHGYKSKKGWEKLKELNVGNDILVTDFKKPLKNLGIGKGGRQEHRHQLKRYTKGYLVKYEKIESIKYLGEEECYDVMMENPNNNFVINDGIVVHNSYAFNKAHASAYSMISYWGMFLKVNYPIEFYYALMKLEPDLSEILRYVVASRKDGVDVEIADVNYSGVEFKIKDGENKIVSGLVDIKGCGIKASQEIFDKQPYSSLSDLLSKVNRRQVHKGVLNSLVKAGAFRSLYPNMGAMLAECNYNSKKERKTGDLIIKPVFEWMIGLPEDKADELYKLNDIDKNIFDEETQVKVMGEVCPIPPYKHKIEYYIHTIDKFFKDRSNFELYLQASENYNNEIEFAEDGLHRTKGIFIGTLVDIKYNNIGDFHKEEPNEKEKKKIGWGKRYANVNIENSQGIKRMNIDIYTFPTYRDVIDKGLQTPVLVVGSLLKWSEVIFVDMMIDLDSVRDVLDKNIGLKQKYKQLSPTERYLIKHPCSFYQEHRKKAITIKELKYDISKGTKQVVVLITRVKNHWTKKKNKKMMFVELEDETGYLSVIAWPECVIQHSRKIIPGQVLRLYIKKNDDGFFIDEKRKIIVEKIAWKQIGNTAGDINYQ